MKYYGLIMNRIKEIKKGHIDKLKDLCEEKNVDFDSLQELIEAEKVKKLLKRKASMQQTISNLLKREMDENTRS